MSPRPRLENCTGCGLLLDDETRRYNKCQECIRDYYRAWSRTPKGKAKLRRAAGRYRQSAHGQRQRKSANLMSDYGITIETFDAMIAAQDFKCAICQSPFTDAHEKKACVDHCHGSSAVRAILCFSCNAGLGLFREDTAALERAIVYLSEHAGNKSVAA